jgi:hypothetical protein
MGVVANVPLYIMCVCCVSHSLERRCDFSAWPERSVCTNNRMSKSRCQYRDKKLPIFQDPASSVMTHTGDSLVVPPIFSRR